MDLILASTSPYRRALLDRVGVPYQVRAPGVDEAELQRRLGPRVPHALPALLAEAKAAVVAEVEVDSVVIASDQLAIHGGLVLGKPGSVARAIEQLSRLQGSTHELVTALVVRRGDRILRHTDVTRLTVRALSDAEIRRYVEAERPLDCAGSYKVEGRGIALFERIESADHTAIIGLPLIALVTSLRSLGYPLP